MPSPVKRTLAFFVLTSLTMSAPLASAAVSTGATINLPATVSPTVTRVVESAITTGAGETTLAQTEVTTALEKLVKIYEGRVTRLQDEVNRLRIENDSLKAKAGLSTTSTGAATVAPIAPVTPATPAVPKTEAEKKFDIIVSNIVSAFPEILKKNNISATGSIGLFEFIEPKSFFISLDDGKNPAGVTAFKTKILFEYDSNLNLKLIGLFELDYASSKYVTTRGSNPFAGVTRIRVKNPSYNGKLLEEIVAPVAPTVPSTGAGAVTPPVTSPTTGAGTTTGTAATLDNIRKAYEKNKLGDVVQMGTTYLQANPNNIEVLTMRARSQYIFSKFDEALNDIESIYKIQGQNIDCGIVNDGARAEKALKGARGAVFGGLQTTKCKK